MYDPCCRNSLAICGSTTETFFVNFLALSAGTRRPHFEHWTAPLEPEPPFARPADFLFFANEYFSPRHITMPRKSNTISLNPCAFVQRFHQC